MGPPSHYIIFKYPTTKCFLWPLTVFNSSWSLLQMTILDVLFKKPFEANLIDIEKNWVVLLFTKAIHGLAYPIFISLFIKRQSFVTKRLTRPDLELSQHLLVTGVYESFMTKSSPHDRVWPRPTTWNENL